MKSLLRVEDIHVSFGGVKALKGVTLDVYPGQVVGLIGPNGSGKTTLFNVISGFLRPEKGNVYLDGRNITHLRPYARARLGIGRTFQVVRPFPHLSVLQHLQGALVFGAGSAHPDPELMNEILEIVQLQDYRDWPAYQLTFPLKRRLEVARALALKPKILLLDEVFAGLTPAEIEDAKGLIRRLQEERITILMVEHLMQATLEVCQHVFVLHHGQVLGEGNPEQIRQNHLVKEVYLGARFA